MGGRSLPSRIYYIQSTIILGRHIIEIGAGVGLTGLVAEELEHNLFI